MAKVKEKITKVFPCMFAAQEAVVGFVERKKICIGGCQLERLGGVRVHTSRGAISTCGEGDRAKTETLAVRNAQKGF